MDLNHAIAEACSWDYKAVKLFMAETIRYYPTRFNPDEWLSHQPWAKLVEKVHPEHTYIFRAGDAYGVIHTPPMPTCAEIIWEILPETSFRSLGY